jgi:UDP-3-O-[3-hydroxymyristoyl] N-acetylglucosamine deacetylase
MLDVIGDLALVGYPVIGHLVVHRGGHALHTALAAELLRQPDAWQFVGAPEPADRSARVRVPARQSLAH